MTATSSRFAVFNSADAHKRGWHSQCQGRSECIECFDPDIDLDFYDTSTNPPTFIGFIDGSKYESENVSWICRKLNEVAQESYISGLRKAASMCSPLPIAPGDHDEAIADETLKEIKESLEEEIRAAKGEVPPAPGTPAEPSDN